MPTSEIKERFWSPLALSHAGSSWATLDRSYRDPRRAYHTWRHIAQLLQRLAEFAHLSRRPDLIAAAIFWHDSVYIVQDERARIRSDSENVRDSAALFMQHALMPQEDAAAVAELIMATSDHLGATARVERYPGFSDDLDLFLDLDLSPLAAPWPEFAANSRDLRFEFSHVPEKRFCEGQIAFFERLVDRRNLFRRAETTQKWRASALANIERRLLELRARLADAGAA